MPFFKTRLKRKEFFLARPVGDIGHWYTEHFEPLGCSLNSTNAVVGKLAKALGVHVTQLLPGDSKELESFGDWLGLEDDDEMELFDSMMYEAFPDEEYCALAKKFGQPKSLSDLVILYDKYAKEEQK